MNSKKRNENTSAKKSKLLVSGHEYAIFQIVHNFVVCGVGSRAPGEKQKYAIMKGGMLYVP